jgi:ligand-binding sensor domain-containing protein
MVRVVHCDRAGVLWLGTNGGGLNRLEKGRFVAYTTKDGLASDLVYSIYEEGNGVLWVGTGGGLSRYENGVFSSFTTKDGLCESRVFQILEDRNGSLWMSSTRDSSASPRRSSRCSPG